MNNFLFNLKRFVCFTAGLSFVFCLIFALTGVPLSAQTKGKKAAVKAKTVVKKVAAKPAVDLPKVTQVDSVALLNLLKREGDNAKPLLVNFWATWCAPCIEEFPDLVKINNDYQGKIDFITVTLDDLAEIETGVPQFLAKMKATMPTYLLKTTDENAAIESISKDWQGGLPFTILYDGKGAVIYSKQAKFVPAVLRRQIDETLNKQNQPSAFEQGKAEAEKDIGEGNLIFKTIESLWKRGNLVKRYETMYQIKILNSEIPCKSESVSFSYCYLEFINYVKGYNSISEAKIIESHGENLLTEIKKRFPINLPANVIGLTLTKK